MASHTLLAYCAAHQRTETFDGHWLALWVDSDNRFVSGHPEHGGDPDYERTGTVLVCGQHGALIVYERYLYNGKLEAARDFPPYEPSALDVWVDRMLDPTLL